MKSIAENMKDILIENHQKSVWYGNISIIEECAKRSNLSNRHPMKLITDILNALDRSKLFQKSYILADFSGKNANIVVLHLWENILLDTV